MTTGGNGDLKSCVGKKKTLYSLSKHLPKHRRGAACTSEKKDLNNLPKYWKPEIAERVAERFHGK